MNTNDLRRIISKSIDKENKTKKLFKLIAQTLEPSHQEDCFNFVKNYIQMTPNLIDIAYNAAQSHGVLQNFQPIFNTIFGYWSEDYDFIPDSNGMIGLCDDAYLSLCFIQEIASSRIPNTNKPLINLDLRNSNQIMRSLIGEPIATNLDQTIAQTFSSLTIQNTLATLFSHPALQMGMQNFGGFNSGMSQYEIDREVDIRLGSMGVV
ncbi:MAG: hypothetical protein R3B93_11325 [Bacteroidia bacterium]